MAWPVTVSQTVQLIGHVELDESSGQRQGQATCAQPGLVIESLPLEPVSRAWQQKLGFPHAQMGMFVSVCCTLGLSHCKSIV